MKKNFTKSIEIIPYWIFLNTKSELNIPNLWYDIICDWIYPFKPSL